MKKWLYIFTILLFALPAAAKHVAGGELFYEYIGPGSTAGTSVYKITLRLFRDCASTGPLLQNESVTVGIYADGLLAQSVYLPLTQAISTISLNTAAFPCLVGNVSVCYQIGIYSATTVLTDNLTGYTLSRIGCCRVDMISNLFIQLNVGSNYVTQIPGTATLPVGHNSSPQFLVKDTALVCALKPFQLNFGATDKDNDSLTYSLCDAYDSPSSSNNAGPPGTLSLIPLPYAFPYSGSFPLGQSVTINPQTGIISGTAPPEGSYVVNVCITEWRNGVPFTQHRKDFILKVQNCDFIEANLPPKIIQCNNYTVHFENGSTSSAIIAYLWQFGDKGNDTSTNPVVDFTYADTGRFLARLTVLGPKGCIGSDSTLILVYPGFVPNYSINGNCYQNPFQFTDLSTSVYGTVNSWFWNFGDTTTTTDTSSLQNPKYKYTIPSTKTISLVVTDSKGCIDSLQKTLIVSDKPLLQLPFKDTLICSIDTLSIPVTNPGNYSWTPNSNILYANTSNPSVYPKTTTQYFVTVFDSGCTSTDTVTVNVLDFISVKAGNDSTICTTDTIRLQPVSAALSYQWTSSSGTVIPNVKYPLVQPLVNTEYYVTGNLGKCQAHDSVMIKVVPYPKAAVGPDTIICFGSLVQLQGSMTGSSLQWLPASSLLNANTTHPTAAPSKTTTYTLQVSDTLGCPKPVSASMVVTVVPPVNANAGNDTSILVNQPLQLKATGGDSYQWSPETGLNNVSIANPVAILDQRFDSIRYQVKVTGQGGCNAVASLVVKVYKTGPEIFVPSAFTPNGDGLNDVLKPVTIGISVLKYFRVYNRWGQLLFSTSQTGKGWDGIYGGIQQPGSTYIYETEGTDYTGKRVFRKGTSVLIR